MIMNGTLPDKLFQQNTCATQTVNIQNQTLGPPTCPQVTVTAQSEHVNVTAIAANIVAPLGVLLLASLARSGGCAVPPEPFTQRLAQHKPMAHSLPAAQITLEADADSGRPPADSDGWQGAYVLSPMEEMSSEGAVIESGGRPAVQELTARGLGD